MPAKGKEPLETEGVGDKIKERKRVRTTFLETCDQEKNVREKNLCLRR